MAEDLERVPGDACVFRLANRGTDFLPADAVLPTSGLFRPSSDDEAEGKERGRPPGLSVWDRGRTTVEQAQHLADKPESEAFGLLAERVRQIGVSQGLNLDVWYDALDERESEPGADGHALIEGLARPEGKPKKTYRDVRRKLAEACEAISG